MFQDVGECFGGRVRSVLALNQFGGCCCQHARDNSAMIWGRLYLLGITIKGALRTRTHRDKQTNTRVPGG